MQTERKFLYFVEDDTSDTVLPPDLSHFENDLRNIERFDGKLPDNVLEHTLRAVLIAQKYLPDNEELARMIFIHDVPEILIGDEILPNKIDKMGDEDLEEIAAAKELLSDNDFERFVKFKNAERWLFDGDIQAPDPTALLAIIIDKVEGNTFYQYHASQGENHFFEQAWEYTKNQRDIFSEKLNTLDDCPEKDAALQILDDQIKYLKKLWNK